MVALFQEALSLKILVSSWGQPQVPLTLGLSSHPWPCVGGPRPVSQKFLLILPGTLWAAPDSPPSPVTPQGLSFLRLQ